MESLQRRQLGPGHPDVLITQYNRGCLLAEAGQHAEAEQLCRRVAAAQAALLGRSHPDALRTQHNLAELTLSGEFVLLPTPAPPRGTDSAADYSADCDTNSCADCSTYCLNDSAADCIADCIVGNSADHSAD